MIMMLNSAEAAKLLKKCKEEFDAIKSKEARSSTFLASVGEDPESVRPQYDYAETGAALDELSAKIRKLKHAVNVFNVTTRVPGYDMTVDEMLVYIPQLTAEKQRLSDMASRLPKEREEQIYARGGSVIDYRYTNYEIAAAEADLLRVTDALSNAQLALDGINHSATFEVDM